MILIWVLCISLHADCTNKFEKIILKNKSYKQEFYKFCNFRNSRKAKNFQLNFNIMQIQNNPRPYPLATGNIQAGAAWPQIWVKMPYFTW